MNPEEVALAAAADAIIDSAETRYYRQRSTRAAGFIGWISCGGGAAYELFANGSDVDPLSAAIIVVGAGIGVAAVVTGYLNRINHEERVSSIQ